MPQTELLTESIHLGDVTVDLMETSIEITVADPHAEPGSDDEETDFWVELAPKTRREANQMSMALRKASRRLEDIAATLPATEDGR